MTVTLEQNQIGRPPADITRDLDAESLIVMPRVVRVINRVGDGIQRLPSEESWSNQWSSCQGESGPATRPVL